MKKIIAFALALCLILPLPALADGEVTVSSECDISDIDVPLDSTVTNAAIGQTLDIKAKSAVLMEPNTGKVLYELNPDEKLPPASITKIMSLLLVMEAIDRGDITTETIVTASEHACSMGGSQIWLEPGETMTVNDLLKAAVIASANDACVALGETIAGSEEGFVAMMNERAKELGMDNTHFVNCTGLDAEGHITSAYDVAIMSSELIKHDLIKDYSTVWMDSLRDGKSELVNTNKLVRFYEGTTGLKTGTTSTAKYCLSATAERNGLELVAVVMAGESSDARFNGAKKLLDYGFANYHMETAVQAGEALCTLPVSGGLAPFAPLLAGETVMWPVTEGETLTVSLRPGVDVLNAPVEPGAQVGEAVCLLNGEAASSVPLICTGAERVAAEKQSPLERLLAWILRK